MVIYNKFYNPITEMYVCESLKYTFTSRSYLLVDAVHILRPSSILYLNATCLLYPFYCHMHHIQYLELATLLNSELLSVIYRYRTLLSS